MYKIIDKLAGTRSGEELASINSRLTSVGTNRSSEMFVCVIDAIVITASTYTRCVVGTTGKRKNNKKKTNRN